MRRSALCFLLAVLPLAAKPDYPRKADALGNPELPRPMRCGDCHEGTPRSQAKGGLFKGPGSFLVERKKKTGAKEVDLAWLKDYRKSPRKN